MVKFNYLSLILPLLLGSCATTYQEEGFFTNGYSNQRLAQDTFVVTYHANEMTQPEQVVEYAMRRSAEVTRKKGYRYFAILEQIDHQSKKKVPGLHYPSVQLTIRCFHEIPPGIDVIDAN